MAQSFLDPPHSHQPIHSQHLLKAKSVLRTREKGRFHPQAVSPSKLVPGRLWLPPIASARSSYTLVV
eukprot:6120907-Prymnesium_polylepis.1